MFFSQPDKFVFLCATGDEDSSKGFGKSVHSAVGVESLAGCLVHTDWHSFSESNLGQNSF